MSKSFYSPYVNVLSTINEYSEGVIDYVKAMGGTASGVIVVTIPGQGSDTIAIKGGESLYGPFSKVVYKTSATSMEIITHERSKIIED